VHAVDYRTRVSFGLNQHHYMQQGDQEEDGWQQAWPKNSPYVHLPVHRLVPECVCHMLLQPVHISSNRHVTRNARHVRLLRL
jgi:hypothetical protein